MLYRINVCDKAWTAKSPGFPSETTDRAKGDKDYWKDTLFKFGPKAPHTWLQALDDIFSGRLDVDGHPVYVMGCQPTIECLHLLGVRQTLEAVLGGAQAETRFIALLAGTVDPIDMRAARNTVNWYSVPAGSVYENNWLPGDWGSFHANGIDDNNLVYGKENLLYAGDCFEESDAGFRNNAMFFGNPNELQTMLYWYNYVKGFPGSTGTVRVNTDRRYFAQPAGARPN